MNYLVRLLTGSACVCGLLAVSDAVHAQVTQKGPLYQFHVRLRQGAKFNYAMKVNTTPPGGTGQSVARPISVSTPVSVVVTGVQNGVSTLKITTGPSLLNGQPQGEARDLEMKVDDRGRPVGAPAPGMENLMGNLPDHPLKVGDSYALKQSVSFSGIPLTVHTRYKFMGLKIVKGRQCADFTVAVTGSGNLPTPQGASAPFTIQGAGVLQVSAADGLMTHSAGDLNVLISQGGSPAKMKVNTTFDRN